MRETKWTSAEMLGQQQKGIEKGGIKMLQTKETLVREVAERGKTYDYILGR